MTEDTDDFRTALNLPNVVQTNLGAVEIHELSARETVVAINKLMSLAIVTDREMKRDANLGWLTAALVVFQKYPDQVLAVFEKTTNLDEGKLGDVDMGGLFKIIAAVVELHEDAIENFFVARAAVEKVMGRIAARSPRLPKSSISSSVPDGHSQTSNGSPSNSSDSTPEKPPSEESKIASGG